MARPGLSWISSAVQMQEHSSALRPRINSRHGPSSRGVAAADGTPLLEAALAYAARGWPVFPLRPRDKIPLIPKAEGGNGVHDATTDPDAIGAWWERRPDANVGLAAGAAFWVLDLDFAGFFADEPDGADTFVALERRFGRLPETVRQQTGGLGWQRFFAADPGIRNGVRMLPGLDTRAAGGYVAAPPSVHPGGRLYRWIVPPGAGELAPAPEWLVALLEPVELPEPVAPARPFATGDLSRYATAAIERACERVAAAPVGQQCDTLEHQAFGIGRLVGGGVLPKGEARTRLVDAGLRMRSGSGRGKDGKAYRPWTRREIEARVERALAAGEAKPRAPEGRG